MSLRHPIVGVVGSVRAVILAVAGLPCYVQARRAMRVDPIVAMRG